MADAGSAADIDHRGRGSGSASSPALDLDFVEDGGQGDGGEGTNLEVGSAEDEDSGGADAGSDGGVRDRARRSSGEWIYVWWGVGGDVVGVGIARGCCGGCDLVMVGVARLAGVRG